MSPPAANDQDVTARAGAAVRVLGMVDQPDTGIADLVQAIASDPIFAAKLMRMANSSYYGLSGQVAHLRYAVAVVGFSAVRTLAVTVAAGLDDPHGAPPGFWRAAALSAAGAEVVAPMLGADQPTAFSVGLLHMLGCALQHQQGPPAMICLPVSDDLDDVLGAEQRTYGVTHDLLAAQRLASWHFPQQVCDIIARHHGEVLPDSSPLERTLQVARALAEAALGATAADPGYAWLTEGRITAPDVPGLVDRVTERADALLAGLRSGS